MSLEKSEDSSFNESGLRVHEHSATVQSSQFNNLEKVILKIPNIIDLFVPVSVCMIFVIGTITTVKFFSILERNSLSSAFVDQKTDITRKLLQSLLIITAMLAALVTVSFVLIFLYVNRYYKIIHTGLIIAVTSLYFIFMHLYMIVVLHKFNLPLDHITCILIIWNFSVIGAICIHWKGPIICRKSYHLISAGFMALFIIKVIPNWTTWALLVFVSIWDLFAVLSSKGPLRILVETAHSRNEDLFPALIYSATVVYFFGMAGESNQITKNEQISNDNKRKSSLSKLPSLQFIQQHIKTIGRTQSLVAVGENGEGISLGLGDFVFYSVLVGTASTYGDWNTTIACFVSILIGLCLTLVLLELANDALPALPISILLGLTAFFATSMISAPFYGFLLEKQVFI